MLCERLATPGDRLILTDIVDHPGPIPAGAEFRRIDLSDKNKVLALAPETGAVLHFGAVATERPFEEIIGPNILGTYHIFELARLAGARVLFASSNHVIGFHERGVMLDEDCDMRPDGFYGLSKATGELMGRLYWDKHAVESLAIRIGSCLAHPEKIRHLSTWISYDDLVDLIEAALSTPRLGCRVVWGMSANTRRWWRNHRVTELGYRPKDNAEDFAVSLDAARTENDPVASRYQGGCFCSLGYSRTEPSPIDIFEWIKSG
jgi:uronate dehydrogenase